MQADGVITTYAIGGAVAATFYLEPSATLDVDIFIVLPQVPAGSLVSLAPIYEYLSARGGRPEGEHIVLGDWPVQFLPASNALELEAITDAIQTEVEGICTRVMAAEHLVAIALRTGRAKDHARILQFLEHGLVDSNRLEDILKRHGLAGKWASFRKKYLDGEHG